MDSKIKIMIGSIIFLIAGGISIAVSFSTTPMITELLIPAIVLVLIGALGFASLKIKSPKTRVFYIVLGIAALVPAMPVCMKIRDMVDNTVAFIILLLPLLVAVDLWVVGERKSR